MQKRRHTLKIFLWILAAVILIPTVGVFALYLYLTPQRLGRIASDQLSKRLRAEVTVKAIGYRLFSTFPDLYITADSIRVQSRSLPSPYDTIDSKNPLLDLESAYIHTNLRELLRGDYHIRALRLGNLRANLVALNDTAANYDILPPDLLDIKKMPKVRIDTIGISPRTDISFLHIPTETWADIDIDRLDLLKAGDHVNLDLFSGLSLVSGEDKYLAHTPLSLKGFLDVRANPLYLSTDNFLISFAGLPASISTTLRQKAAMSDAADKGDAFDISRLICSLRIDEPLKRLRRLPANIRPDLSSIAGLDASTSILLTAILDDEWDTASRTLPNFNIDFRLLPGHIAYTLPQSSPLLTASRIDAFFSEISGRIHLIPDAILNSTLRLRPFSIAGEGLAIDLKPTVDGHIGNPDLAVAIDLKADLAKVASLLPLTPATAVRGDLDLKADLAADKAATTLKKITADQIPDLLKGYADLRVNNLFYKSGDVTVSGNTSLSANADTLLIHSLSGRAYATSARVSGRVTGLRPYLLGKPGDHSLDITAKALIDTLDVDRLAYLYYMANGGVPKRQTPLPPEASDSVAVRMPDFIHARVDIAAPHAVYYNVPISDFSTTVSLAPGRARLGDLVFTTPFTDAGLDIAYDSRRLDSLAYKASVDIDRLDIDNFLTFVPELARLAPQLALIHGAVSVDGSLGGTFFPDMAIDAPAFHADASLTTDGLSFSQSPDIRKYSRWLFRKDADIPIDNIRLKAMISGNLIRIMPTDIKIPGYALQLTGINNFDGDMYYHAAVLHDPLRLPFAINLEGSMSHVKPRLGGVRFDTKKALRVASMIQEEHNFNFPNAVRNFLSDFFRLAAEAYEENQRSGLLLTEDIEVNGDSSD